MVRLTVYECMYVCKGACNYVCMHACVCTAPTPSPALTHLITFQVGIILRPLRRQSIAGTSISTSMLFCKISHKQGL